MTDASPRWEADFDVWGADLEGTRVAILVDMAANDHAPLASHPVRLQVRVRLARPRADGLLADDEADALFAVEDALAARAAKELEAIYVGRVVAEGAATFAFYLPPAQAHRADEHAADILGRHDAYRLEWLVAGDPEWSYYRELLYPDDRARAEMLTRRATDRMMHRE